MNWSLEIYCDGQLAGPPIPRSEYDVWSSLAAYQNKMPAGWTAKAYFEVTS